MINLEPKIVKFKKLEKYQRLLDNTKDTINIKSGFVMLRPEERVGEHITENKEELIIILQGKAEISFGKKNLFISRKDNIIYIPPETKHDVKNIGKDLLEYIYVVSPIKKQ
ncbi:MAG: cupin domain-containing protein [Candidatus Omnitrophota bacterium]